MNPIKYLFVFFTYLWLRFDPIIYITFQKDWQPRYDFMKNIYGEKDTRNFLKKRVKLVKRRKRPLAPIILPSMGEEQTTKFLKLNPDLKQNQVKRISILNKLIFWATDSEINRTNIDSYKTRQTIIDSLLSMIFQNSLLEEATLILDNLNKIVFSRVTYLGSKGEPSPVVHDSIISGVGRILTQHFNEIVRLRDERLDKLTKVKMIKEIQKGKKDTGSLAFSADVTHKKDQFRQRYPLETDQAKMLLKILNHYQFSAWPDSRKKAINLIETMEKQLGFKLEQSFN